jgi:hypothetical protein
MSGASLCEEAIKPTEKATQSAASEVNRRNELNFGMIKMFGKVKVTKVIGGFGGLYIIYEWVGDLVFLWGDFFLGGGILWRVDS